MVKEYVQVVEKEGEEDDMCELPVEKDGTVLLSTLVAQFPGATGIKYRREGSKAARAIRLEDGRLYAPDDGQEGWGDIVYFCVFPKELKRKADDEESSPPKKSRSDDRKPCDLVVLKLDYSVTTTDLKKYFEKFGEVVTATVKTDSKTGKAKGFGFVRFAKISAQDAVLDKYEHTIGGKTSLVRIPDWEVNNRQEGASRPLELTKIYVGNLKEEISKDDIQKFFSKYGKVKEVFMPIPFREFCFVTFDSSKVAQELCGQTLTIKGNKATISTAAPKQTDNNFRNQGGFNQNNFNRNPWGNNMGGGGYGNNPNNDRNRSGMGGMGGMTGMGMGGGFNNSNNMGGRGFQGNNRGTPLDNYNSGASFGNNFQTPPPTMGGNMGSSPGNNMNPNIMAAALQAGLALLGAGGNPPTGGNFGSPSPNMGTGGNMMGMGMNNRSGPGMGSMNMGGGGMGGRKY